VKHKSTVYFAPLCRWVLRDELARRRQGIFEHWENTMGVAKMYDKLIKKWGRQLANEIMLKRASRLPQTKKRSTGNSWSPVLPGSYETGKRR